MLFETASHEISLLVFSVLVPMGLAGMGLAGFLRSSMELSDEKAVKFDQMMVIPAVVTLLGLVAGFTHLGSPTKAFGMISGLGASPLSNEIMIAGVSIAVAIVYCIVCLVKHPAAGLHKVFGIALLVLGVVTALFTGLAYMMPTIATWNSPVSSVSQIFAALMGGAALAALVFACVGEQAGKLVEMLALVGAAGVAVMVIVQGALFGGVQNAAGMTLAGSMTQYWLSAVVGIVCMAVSVVAIKKFPGVVTSAVAAIAAVAGLAMVRVCFYGIFLSVGLF